MPLLAVQERDSEMRTHLMQMVAVAIAMILVGTMAAGCANKNSKLEWPSWPLEKVGR